MEDGWKPNLEQLARLIDENTCLLYLVHPHNPTGATLQVEEMQAIARMAQRVGALVVNDELFRLISLDGEPTPLDHRRCRACDRHRRHDQAVGTGRTAHRLDC